MTSSRYSSLLLWLSETTNVFCSACVICLRSSSSECFPFADSEKLLGIILPKLQLSPFHSSRGGSKRCMRLHLDGQVIALYTLAWIPQLPRALIWNEQVKENDRMQPLRLRATPTDAAPLSYNKSAKIAIPFHAPLRIHYPVPK